MYKKHNRQDLSEMIVKRTRCASHENQTQPLPPHLLEETTVQHVRKTISNKVEKKIKSVKKNVYKYVCVRVYIIYIYTLSR